MVLNSIGYNRGHHERFVLKRAPRMHEYVMLILRSHTFFVSDGDTVLASPGTVFIYDRTTPHHFGAHGEPFLHDWLAFSIDDSERERLLSLGLSFDTIMKPYSIFPLSEMVKVMEREKYSGGANSRKITSLYLEILLLKLAEQIDQKGSAKSSYHAELVRLRAEIYASPAKWHTAEELARRLNISVSYFQHLYKKQFCTSPATDMINSRTEYAKYLLSSTDYSVKMIAEELSYPSDVQFIQQFKSVAGQTPLQYRKSNIKK